MSIRLIHRAVFKKSTKWEKYEKQKRDTLEKYDNHKRDVVEV